MIASMGGSEEGSGDNFNGYSGAGGDSILVAYLIGWEHSEIFNYKYEGKSASCISDGKYICYTDYDYDAGDRNYGPGVCHRDTSGNYMHKEEYATYGIDISSGAYDDVGVDKIELDIVDGVFGSMLESRFMQEVKQETEGYNLSEHQFHALVCVAYQYGNVDGASEFLASGGTDRTKFWVNSGQGFKYYPFKEGGGKGGDERVNANWKLFNEGIYQTRSGKTLNPEQFGNSNSKATSKYTTFENFVFIGDSYTEGLKSYVSGDEKFKNAKFNAVSGKTPQYWIDNFSSLPTSANGVCVLLGVNNPSQTKNMQELINKLVEQYGSNTPIYIQKVFPVGKDYTDTDTLNTNIKKYNEETKKYISEIGYDNVKFIDTTSGCIDQSGYLKYTDDGLHLNSTGYSKWVKNLKKTILKDS